MAIKNIGEDGSATSAPKIFVPPAIILPTNFIPEQRAVIESTEPIIKVRAGAGSGKTTTLIGLAEFNSKERMLYLAFNKAIQEDAARKFGRNVVCQTVNSVAYNAMNVGRVYGHKLVPFVKAKQVSDMLGVPYYAAALALSTINAYLYSADREIGELHAVRALVKPSNLFMITNLAREIWEIMIDKNNSKVGITHDGYMKLFQLSGKSLGNYDRILLDEAQDTNPITAALVEAHGGKKVYVGDRNQSIYAFRGAENAMDTIAAKEYLLSSSFRFGQSVADIANLLLEHTLGDDFKMTGLGAETAINAPITGKYALLSRTNGALFEAAVAALEEGKKVCIIGGPESLKLQMLIDTYRLSVGEVSSIITPAIKQFKNFPEMERLTGGDVDSGGGEEAKDLELSALCRAVKKYGGRIPALATRIDAKCRSSKEEADITLSTAHKAKGLEFDNVVMADDFADPSSPDGTDIQEGNLLYVTATRAMKNLVLNKRMNAFVHEPVKNPKLAQEKMRKFQMR